MSTLTVSIVALQGVFNLVNGIGLAVFSSFAESNCKTLQLSIDAVPAVQSIGLVDTTLGYDSMK